jgi:hypothetical protein
MRKEIFLAIVVGILVGLVITFGLYSLRQRLLPNRTAEEIAASREQNPTPTPRAAQTTLAIQQPRDNYLSQNEEIKVVGRALPNSHVTILTPTTEYITLADQDGDFAQDVTLTLGGNRVSVIAISPDGNQEEVILSVVYSTVDLSTQSATPEGEQGEQQ